MAASAESVESQRFRAMVAGRFLADPPDVRLREPSPEHLVAKRAFEVDRLRSWFGR
jgi:hypothetical protein